MAKIPTRTKRIIRVGIATKEQLSSWSEGASLVSAFGVSIDELKRKAVCERWKLALEHRKEAKRLLTCTSPPFRAIVSRWYYVMYHSMRAACYLYHSGDDYEAHSTLPLNLPKDLPNLSTWRNTMKQARLDRNAADYDPYPKSMPYWRGVASTIEVDAKAAVAELRSYLRGKGCRIK